MYSLRMRSPQQANKGHHTEEPNQDQNPNHKMPGGFAGLLIRPPLAPVDAGHPVGACIGRPACLGDGFCWCVLCAHGILLRFLMVLARIKTESA